MNVLYLNIVFVNKLERSFQILSHINKAKNVAFMDHNP